MPNPGDGELRHRARAKKGDALSHAGGDGSICIERRRNFHDVSKWMADCTLGFQLPAATWKTTGQKRILKTT